MGRILAIDYGRKRTGVAVTDPLKIIANALGTYPTHTLMDFLKDYTQREEVETIVIGLPKQLNGEPSESMRYITPFVNRLKKEMPQMPVVMYDERFTRQGESRLHCRHHYSYRLFTKQFNITKI